MASIISVRRIPEFVGVGCDLQLTKRTPFVCNGVIEIQGITNPAHWRHCSGKSNPADLVTRAISANFLIVSRLWWHGPDWLSASQEAWSNENDASEDRREITDALSEARNRDYVVVFACQSAPKQELCFDRNMQSHWTREVRITGWIRRFVHNCRDQANRRTEGALTVEEIKESEDTWFKIAQSAAFGNELAALSAGKPIDKTSAIHDLHPFVDNNGVRQIRTRLDKAATPEEVRCPILLLGNHRDTHLIVGNAHGVLFTVQSVALSLKYTRGSGWFEVDNA